MSRKPEITDRDCLRSHFQMGVEAYLLTPWTEDASAERGGLLSEAEQSEQSAAEPIPARKSIRAPEHVQQELHCAHAIHLREEREWRDRARHDALCLRDHANSIPQSDFDGAYIRTLKERLASLRYYAALCNGVSHETALSTATKIREARVRLPEEARIALRDTLDELAELAGYPVWRKTFGRTLLGHDII